MSLKELISKKLDSANIVTIPDPGIKKAFIDQFGTILGARADFVSDCLAWIEIPSEMQTAVFSIQKLEDGAYLTRYRFNLEQ